jgi:hypothetical protein
MAMTASASVLEPRHAREVGRRHARHGHAALLRSPDDHAPDDGHEELVADDEAFENGARVAGRDEEPNAFDGMTAGAFAMFARA